MPESIALTRPTGKNRSLRQRKQWSDLISTKQNGGSVLSAQLRLERGQQTVEEHDGLRCGSDRVIEIHERRKGTLRWNVVIGKHSLDAAGRPHAGERVLHVNLPDHSDLKTKFTQELGVRIRFVHRVAQRLPVGTQ